MEASQFICCSVSQLQRGKIIFYVICQICAQEPSRSLSHCCLPSDFQKLSEYLKNLPGSYFRTGYLDSILIYSHFLRFYFMGDIYSEIYIYGKLVSRPYALLSISSHGMKSVVTDQYKGGTGYFGS